MKLFEFEGKQLLSQSGIAVPEGRIAGTVEEAVQAAKGMGPVMLKAQVLWGSRGKRGAILACDTEEEVREAAKALLDMIIEDETVEQVLVEKRIEVEKEYYLSLTFKDRTPVVLASSSGGMDIEDFFLQEDSRGILTAINILEGLDGKTAKDILRRAGFGEDAEPVSEILRNLYNVFMECDAMMVEVNPLARSKSGPFCALDAKVEIDDDAFYRLEHLHLSKRLSSGRKPTRLESLALENDELDSSGAAGRMFYEIPGGNIIVLASGGGTSVEALDSLCLQGGRPSVFTEYSGNPTGEKVKGLTRTALMSEQPIDAVWVIGGRANFTDIYETLVNGVLEGIRDTEHFDKTVPIIVRRAGPRDEEAFDSLRKAREAEGYNILIRGMGTSVSESARMVVHQANKHRGMREGRTS